MPQDEITVTEYIAKAKDELDAFAKNWEVQRQLAPHLYPASLSAADWGEQELAGRFGQC